MPFGSLLGVAGNGPDGGGRPAGSIQRFQGCNGLVNAIALGAKFTEN